MIKYKKDIKKQLHKYNATLAELKKNLFQGRCKLRSRNLVKLINRKLSIFSQIYKMIKKPN